LITNITIKNFKSIIEVPLSLSRINIFIGENGAGKSNILEAIVLAGAASADKLDNEFLTSRGLRVTQAEFMRPAFPGTNLTDPISIYVSNSENESKEFLLFNDNEPYSKWEAKFTSGSKSVKSAFQDAIKDVIQNYDNEPNSKLKAKVDRTPIPRVLASIPEELAADIIMDAIQRLVKKAKAQGISEEDAIKMLVDNTLSSVEKEIENFLIYSPENSALRAFQREGQIEPLGINGEGLLKFISVISEDSDNSPINEIKSSLKLLGWFEDFKLTGGILSPAHRMEVKDSYIENDKRYFDQMSTNEGFLFLLFYFAAVTSKLTPKFFGIDNIDASLNPKLCEGMIKKLVSLAKQHDKQIILTTHNPATLDGLNLDDDEQRLFVVSRGRAGETNVTRVNKPIVKAGKPPVRLSEMFIKGILGGLPKGF
jgi:AAA15 family ATPase/GTPase